MSRRLNKYPMVLPYSSVWVTKDGEEFRLHEMRRSHIEYAMARCKQKGWRTAWIPLFEFELFLRDFVGRKD